MQENLFTPNSIRVFSGKYVNILEPTEDSIDIIDIAHSLSMQCRFGGHLSEHYSVAQHSLNCSFLASKEFELEALMHDASEAYLMDIPRPIKLLLPDYKIIEDRFMKVIAKKFGFNYPLSEEVKKVDNDMLQFEWDTLVLKCAPFPGEYYKNHLLGRQRFLDRFHILTDNKFKS